MVTLRVRVWIETKSLKTKKAGFYVTLRVRVWIETKTLKRSWNPISSHPPREGVD